MAPDVLMRRPLRLALVLDPLLEQVHPLRLQGLQHLSLMAQRPLLTKHHLLLMVQQLLSLTVQRLLLTLLHPVLMVLRLLLGLSLLQLAAMLWPPVWLPQMLILRMILHLLQAAVGMALHRSPYPMLLLAAQHLPPPAAELLVLTLVLALA